MNCIVELRVTLPNSNFMKILMVCLGNICRSPLAEGILTHLVEKQGLDWQIDSAGTSSWHVGEAPHRGSIDIAARHGIDIRTQRARQFQKEDFQRFDLILAMDSENHSNIIAMAQNEEEKSKVELILNYAHPGMNLAVPDPYYSGGFDKVYNMIEEACTILLNKNKG